MDKKKALAVIFQAADLYEQNLLDRMLLILSKVGKTGRYNLDEVLFEAGNFLHLTGCRINQSQMNAKDFFEWAISRDLKIEHFEDGGNAAQKLEVLPDYIKRCIQANMIAKYERNACDTETCLHVKNIAGSVKSCMGFRCANELGNVQVPVTLLAGNKFDGLKERNQIIAIFRKKKHEAQYTECCYQAKKVEWGKVKIENNMAYVLTLLDLPETGECNVIFKQ